MESTLKPLICSLQSPVKIGVDVNGSDFKSGYKVIRVNFPSVLTPEVDEIHFKNNYTALLSIKVKFREQITTESRRWKSCLRHYKLMPHPHTENGGQNNFIIKHEQLTCDLSNVLALKFILQQPSPVWLDFSITDIKLFKYIRASYQNNVLPVWMKDEESKKENPKKFDLDLDTISSTMQQIWALTQQASNVQCETSLGRYEVDGAYDINLLT